MITYAIKDNDTDEIIQYVDVFNDDDLIEQEEMAGALGFYLEEVR